MTQNIYKEYKVKIWEQEIKEFEDQFMNLVPTLQNVKQRGQCELEGCDLWVSTSADPTVGDALGILCWTSLLHLNPHNVQFFQSNTESYSLHRGTNSLPPKETYTLPFLDTVFFILSRLSLSPVSYENTLKVTVSSMTQSFTHWNTAIFSSLTFLSSGFTFHVPFTLPKVMPFGGPWHKHTQSGPFSAFPVPSQTCEARPFDKWRVTQKDWA